MTTYRKIRTQRKTAEAKLLIWSTIRRLKDFRIPPLAERLELPDRTVYDYINYLERIQYVRQLDEYDRRGQRGNSATYRLEYDTGMYPPYESKGQLIDPNLRPELRAKREKLWQAIRLLRSCDSAQLASVTDQNQGAISRYLKFLADHEYLRVSSPNASGKAGSWITYFLINDTGPLAPMRRRDGSLYDPNEDLKEIKERALCR